MWQTSSKTLAALAGALAAATAIFGAPAPQSSASAAPPSRLPPLVPYASAPAAARPEPHANFSHQAQKQLSDALATPPAPRSSLLRFDLNSRVDVAVLSHPEQHTNRFGQSTVAVPALRLEW